MNPGAPQTHPQDLCILCPETENALLAVRLIFQEYADSLSVPECFEGFDQEVGLLPWEYAAPRGQLLVAMDGDQVVACCAVRPLDSADYSNACEIRRLYVRPSHRGLSLGRKLAEAQIDFARIQGYDCMLLDTLSDMEAARALYEDLGFEEIPPYYFNPIAGAHYLKVDL
jgi:ribosomal protein S18 acetylase RimI-like enzyme